MIGSRYDGAEPEYLHELLTEWETLVARGDGGGSPISDVLLSPTVVFDDAALEVSEVEIDLDPRVGWDRRERFAQLLMGEGSIREITHAEEPDMLVVARQSGTDSEVEAMVGRVWIASE